MPALDRLALHCSRTLLDSGPGPRPWSRLKGNAGMTYCRNDGFKILGESLRLYGGSFFSFGEFHFQHRG